MLKRLLLTSAIALGTIAPGIIGQAHASTMYIANLNSLNEVPIVESPGGGTAAYTLNGNDLTVALTFFNLSGPAVAGHIHCCAPLGTNAPVAIPFAGLPNAYSGSFNHTFDLTQNSIYTSAFLANYSSTAAAEAAIINAFNTGLAYTNIHTVANPGGEIRGQIAAVSTSAVPEPGTFVLLGTGLVGAVGAIRRRFTAAA